jgi:hypothetical protein
MIAQNDEDCAARADLGEQIARPGRAQRRRLVDDEQVARP